MEAIDPSLIMGQIRVEYLKLRRHFLLVVAVAAPLVAIAVGILDISNHPMTGAQQPHAIWQRMYGAFWLPWLVAMLPVLTSFYIATLVNFEHAGNHWKQLAIYRAPVWSLCGVKIVYASFLSLLSTAIYSIGWIFFWTVLVRVTPELQSPGPPAYLIINLAAKAWLASLMIIPLQAWLSGRVRGNGASLFFAVICLVIGVILFEPKSWVSYVYPWTLCLSTGQSLGTKHNTSLPAFTGLIGGVAASILVCWRLGRRGGATLAG